MRGRKCAKRKDSLILALREGVLLTVEGGGHPRGLDRRLVLEGGAQVRRKFCEEGLVQVVASGALCWPT